MQCADKGTLIAVFKNILSLALQFPIGFIHQHKYPRPPISSNDLSSFRSLPLAL